MTKKQKKILRFLSGGVVTIGIFIFIFQKVNLNKFITTFKNTNLKIVFITLIVSGISNTLIAGSKWKFILDSLGCPINLKETMFIRLGSRIFPFKTDEVARAAYLKRLKEISYSTAIFSIVTEYLIGFIALFIFIGIGLLTYVFKMSTFPYFLNKNLIYNESLNIILLGWIGNKRNFFKKLFFKFSNLRKKYSSEFRKLLNNKKILLCTVVYWGLDLFNVYLLSIAVGNKLPFLMILIFIPVVIIVGGIPISIGGLGTREITLIFLFSSYGSWEVLLSLSLLYYFVEQLFPNLISVIFSGMFINRMVWKGER